MRAASHPSTLASVVAALVALAAPALVRPDVGPGTAAAARRERLKEFTAALAPIGEWLELPRAGKVWRPVRVEPDWRPYFHGSWTWTEKGWFWVTDEPWGWATYHYGRWLFHESYGWLWVPGATWAPAWVAWRWSDEAIGWAPLPPAGPAFAAFWTFVPAARFVGERADEAAFPQARVPALLLKTRTDSARAGTARSGGSRRG